MTNQLTWARVALIALVALALPACGGGGDDDDDSAGATTTTTAAAWDVAADRAAAEDAVLRLDDLPSGWTSSPASDDSDAGANADLAACLKVDPAELDRPDNPTRADSPDFSEPNSGATVSSSIVFTETAAEAKRVLEIYGATETPGCLAEVTADLLAAQAPAGTTIGDVAATRLVLTSDADETSAIRLVIPLGIEGVDVEQYLDMVLLRIGRAGVTVTFSNTGSPVPTDFEQRLVGVVVTRLTGGTASGDDGDATVTTTEPQTTGDRLVAMALSTPGEEAALALAATDDGRRWAAGNPDGSLGMASGTPVLGGYMIKLDDGTTQHQVKVLNGTAVLAFGSTGPPTIESSFDSYWPTLAPESAQQEAAITAATAVVASVLPTVNAGGVDGYVFYFPPTPDGSRPTVTIAANQSTGTTFQFGGTEVL